MNWYGLHSGMTKQEARQILPPKACRRCIHWFRCFWAADYKLERDCSRCGTAIGINLTGAIKQLQPSQTYRRLMHTSEKLVELAAEYLRLSKIAADCPCDPCILDCCAVLDQIIIESFDGACVPSNRMGEVLPKTHKFLGDLEPRFK